MSLSSAIKYEKKRLDIEYRDNTNGKKQLRCLPHFHQELELVYMLSGETRVMVDAQEFVIGPGDVLLTFPNQIHSYESHAEERFLLIIIKPDIFPELGDAFKAGLPVSPVIKGAAELPHIRELFTLLQQIYHPDEDAHPFSGVARRGTLLALLSTLLASMSVSTSPTGELSALRAVIDYCTKHFAGEISLSVLEEELHLNKYYISHLFNDRIHVHFNHYINSLRINEAKRWLLHSDRTIAEIGGFVGFNTLRTFNRAFAEQEKMTPSQYRKKHAAEQRQTGDRT